MTKTTLHSPPTFNHWRPAGKMTSSFKFRAQRFQMPRPCGEPDITQIKRASCPKSQHYFCTAYFPFTQSVCLFSTHRMCIEQPSKVPLVVGLSLPSVVSPPPSSLGSPALPPASPRHWSSRRTPTARSSWNGTHR